METGRLPIFQERFRMLRGEKTQGQFAEELGISRPTVGLYESGARIPDAEILRDIALKCGVSVDWLLGLSDVKTNNPNIKSVCDYTGLTEESINSIRSFRRDHFYSKIDLPVPAGLQGHQDRMDVFNALMQSNKFSRDVLAPILIALSCKDSALGLLNTDLVGIGSAEAEDVMVRQDELYRDLKFNFYDAVEGFRKLVDSTFLFGDIAERMDNQLNAWLMMDDKNILEAEADYGEYQEDRRPDRDGL